MNFGRNDVVRPILPEPMDRYRASQESDDIFLRSTPFATLLRNRARLFPFRFKRIANRESLDLLPVLHILVYRILQPLSSALARCSAS